MKQLNPLSAFAWIAMLAFSALFLAVACSVSDNGSSCGDGQIMCGRTCVTLSSDPNNCGACGTSCGANEVCSVGSCSSQGCTEGYNQCGQGCVDLSADASHCGACNNACQTGYSCVSGSCQCVPGTSCDTGSGGSDGAGGSSPGTGGVQQGTGSTGNTGGVQQGTGSTRSTGGDSGTGGGSNVVSCNVEITSQSTAAMMPTVGIVEFSTDVSNVTSAEIEFGLDTEYGMVAPVDLDEPNYHTLLLGMASNTQYHFRVAVSSGSDVCYSDDQTIQSGPIANGGPSDVSPEMGASSSEPASGFIITSTGASGGGWAWIVNSQGQVVWSYQFPANELTRARMSWDGKYMYGRDLGPFNDGSGGTIYRVAMDGSGEEALQLPGGSHHDFAVTPDGIAYIAKQQSGGCDHIYTAAPDGSNAQSLLDLWEVLEHFPDNGGAISGEICHVNAIEYSEEGDFYTISDREKDMIAQISSSGEILMTVGQDPTQDLDYHLSASAVDGNTWRVQHGHHLYAEDKLLVFSNGPLFGGGGGSSKVLHFTLGDSTATLDWQYSGMGNSATMGGTLHLPNGHVLAVSSQTGTIDEIDANQELVQRLTYQTVGYAMHRPDLYGPPPLK